VSTLLLMRHAKARPVDARQPDRARPLTDGGRRDARRAGKALAGEWFPDLILCSPSVRTVETLDEVVGTLPHRPDSIMVDSLYHGGQSDYLAAIADHGGGARRLLLIGHNPTIHETAVSLAKSSHPKMSAKFPTAALAVLEFDTEDWARLRPGMGRLLRFLRPKDLGAMDADD
jgi:phosphohistidine phosphatase